MAWIAIPIDTRSATDINAWPNLLSVLIIELNGAAIDWINSFLSKDSTGRYLTALRGFSFNFQPDELTSFDTTIASPKNLWQDYSALDNVIAVSRLKHHFTDRFMLGGTFTSRTGFLSDSDQKIDSQNYVGGMDFGYELLDGLMAFRHLMSLHAAAS